MRPTDFMSQAVPFAARWRLPARTVDYLVVRSGDPLLQEQSRRVPALFVTSQLERWLGSPSARVLEALYEALGGWAPLGLSSLEYGRYRQQLTERLSQAFASGELVALELERPEYHLPSRPRPPPKPRPEEVAAEEVTFVAIELVDEEGRPVGYQRFRLELADGGTREGRLNAHGYARVDGLRPGQCKVLFPDLDSEAWS